MRWGRVVVGVGVRVGEADIARANHGFIGLGDEVGEGDKGEGR